MHATTGAQTTPTAHPSFCDHQRCTRRGSSLHHRSPEFMFLPEQRGTTEAAQVWVTLERLDEIDEHTGAQTEQPTEVVFDYSDGRRVRWGAEDLGRLKDLIFGLCERSSCAPTARALT